MNVYVEKIDRDHMSIGDITRHYKYRARWINDGIPFVDNFRTWQKVREYFSGWNATIVKGW